MGAPLAPTLDKPDGPFGFIARAADDGRIVWEYAVQPSDMNPYGVLHGGVLMTLMDTAMGWEVAMRIVPQGRINAAAQMNVHFLAPVRSGLVRARAEVVKIGKRLAIVDARVTDDQGNLVAIATATHSLLGSSSPAAP